MNWMIPFIKLNFTLIELDGRRRNGSIHFYVSLGLLTHVFFFIIVYYLVNLRAQLDIQELWVRFRLHLSVKNLNSEHRFLQVQKLKTAAHNLT